MLKLLIVDDEYIVRRGMRRIVPWNELNISIVGEAEDVAEALETAKRVYPDIVICDICLPGGEGFLIVDEIRKIIPWVQFIMITAHSDKEYMIRAIYEEVCDYLFKPAKVEDIKAAVARAGDKVLEYQDKMKKDLNYQNFILENMDILREKFILNMLQGSLSEEKIIHDGISLKLNLKGPCYRLLFFTIRWAEFDKLIQQVSGCLEAYHPACAQLGENNIVVILNCREEEDGRDIRSLISKLGLEEMQLSENIQVLTELSEVYNEMIGALKKSGQDKDMQITLPDEDLQQIKQTLYEAVKYHDSQEEIMRLFELYLKKAKAIELPEREIVKECRNIIETVSVLTGITKDRLLKSEEITDIKKSFEQLCREIKDAKQYPLDDISGKVLYFIKKRYMEDLSLEQIAAELFMSVSYLSRIIKKRTGHGFAHWINYYRIEAAKECLKNPNVNIEEVARECGYNSYRIFSDHFRKYTGKTASAYRAELEQNV